MRALLSGAQVTHRLEELEWADTATLMGEGGVVRRTCSGAEMRTHLQREWYGG